jgi:isopenicillin N synthase-like dioxygenase
MLPIIDISGLRAQDFKQSLTVAQQIHDAFCDTGFLYITGHGVPQDVIDRATSEAMGFFQEPQEIKNRVAVSKYHRGFNALGDALMYGASKPDYKEFYQVGLELSEEDADVIAGQPLRGPNNWPEWHEIAACGQDLLRGVALSLDLPPDFFVSRYQKPLQRTQAVYYPPHPAEAEDDLFGLSAHSDFGCITLLWQDNNGGLEAQTVDGEWIPAPPIEGTLIVNVGDLLERWSNNRFQSTIHRVMNRSGRERLSIATFYDPDFNAMVDPTDLGIPPNENVMFPPVSAGAHILDRIDRSFGYRKKVT